MNPEEEPIKLEPIKLETLAPSQKAPPRRQKVPIEPGYTLRDWYRIITERTFQTEKVNQLARTSHLNKAIPLSEVRKHKTQEDCWTVLRGKVYDITPYIRFHPGGVEKIMLGAGRDCTNLFDKYHHWVNYETLLEKCYLGNVQNDMQAMIHAKRLQPNSSSNEVK